MRRFASYGPVDNDLHYHAPRKELINKAYHQLLGENPKKGGHYITVWAPRQTGKTWLMQQIRLQLKQDQRFHTIVINLEHLKDETETEKIINTIAEEIGERLNKDLTSINNQIQFQKIFKKDVIEKPLILILDEFDALGKKAINTIVGAFRSIYNNRLIEIDKPTDQKTYLLHSVALIGIRSVLGIESDKGSPFNVQRNLHIPNLTYQEVEGMFTWYEKESGQRVEKEVINNVYDETRGQPGLTCWFGELLTETYNEKKDQPINMENYERVHQAAVNLLPNTNILNIINKARKEPYKELVLEMFRTDKLFSFKFDDTSTNFLYMNGVIEPVEKENKNFIRFASPFVQKRFFNYFSNELFKYMDRLVEPFDNLEDTITDRDINIKNTIKRYQTYLQKNRDWLFKDAPRRKDMRIFEAVFHFNIYMYLYQFIEPKGGSVYPEFPTGNGKIDIVIKYKQRIYGIELKTYTDYVGYKDALRRAADYGKKLGLQEITLVFFVDTMDKQSRDKYEREYLDEANSVKVIPIFVETAN
jgi:hypothetical protein